MQFKFKVWCAKWWGKWQRSRHFLSKVHGVIHVGANSGQERTFYQQFGLEVIWIEPVPATFERLRTNLHEFPEQRAYRYLITDEDDHEYAFHIANNDEASSSILPIAKHKQMYPEVEYTDTITLTSKTLDTFVKRERVDLQKFQALILDTQGSELLILRGAPNVLQQIRFVKAEVADFESYAGCCQLEGMGEFMRAAGFRERKREAFMSLPDVGTYYDVTYERFSACEMPMVRHAAPPGAALGVRGSKLPGDGPHIARQHYGQVSWNSPRKLVW